MTWNQTISGKAFDLVHPLPEQVDFDDMAWHLSRICRFNGGTKDFYSVAEHSTRVASIVCDRAERGEAERLAPAYALIHDAHEYVLGDDTTVKKEALPVVAAELYGPDAAVMFRAVVRAQVERIDAAIHAAAGLPYPAPLSIQKSIKQADLQMLVTERRDHLAPCGRPWSVDALNIHPVERPLDVPLSMFNAERVFRRFCDLLLPVFAASNKTVTA